MQSNLAKAKPEAERSINIVRLYDAPRPMVWKAWTTDQVAKWWGPRGFTITTHSKDLKSGGHWDYTMHGPDGTDWPNVTKYLEVVANEKLVYDHGGTHDKPALFRVTVLFSDAPGGKTKMDMTMTVPTPEALEGIKNVIKNASGNSTWDRLAEHLEKEASGKEQFVINRSLDAPIGLVWDAWTKPEFFSQWMGPKGASMQILRGDIKAGGSLFYAMPFGEITMYGRAEYRLVEKPHRIVYTQQFCDKNEKAARHPMSPTWPETMLTQVTFAEEGPDKTRVTVTWEPLDAGTNEVKTFVEGKSGMTGGWTGSFDKLEEFLAGR